MLFGYSGGIAPGRIPEGDIISCLPQVISPVAVGCRMMHLPARADIPAVSCPASDDRKEGAARQITRQRSRLERMKWLKKNGVTLFLVLVMLTGAGIMAYPTFADWWNTFHQSRAVASYVQTVEQMDTDVYDRIFRDAEEYNRKVAETGTMWNMTAADHAEYERQLKVEGSDIMGYIDIDKVNIHLPIYHGTDESVLQVAVGHLEDTSLPIGGESSHCVLSGHRGLPSAKLFTDIDRLVEGDIFVLTVLNQEATYEVDQILTVLPDETESLAITPGMDFCTLVTCTPYGVNTHRLLIRGHRIPNIEKQEQKTPVPVIPEIDRYEWIPQWIRETPIFILAPAGTVALIIVIFLIRLLGRIFRKKK